MDRRSIAAALLIALLWLPTLLPNPTAQTVGVDSGLPQIGKLARIVKICSLGACDYADVATAFAHNRSTALLPIIFDIGPGTYVGQVSFAGQSNFMIRGAGIDVTTIDANGQTGQDGTLKPGNSTNYIIENLTIEGHQALRIDPGTSGTAGGKIIIRNVKFVTDGVADAEDCIAAGNVDGDSWAANTDFFISDTICDTTQDGYTFSSGMSNVRIFSSNNVFVTHGTATNTMELFRLNGIPSVFSSQGDRFDISTSRTSDMEIHAYRFRGDSLGSCASGCPAYINGAIGRITNTSSGVVSGAIFATVDTNAAELGSLIVQGASITSVCSDAVNCSARGIQAVNATTSVLVYNSRIRTSGGVTNFDLSSAPAKAITYMATDWLTFNGGNPTPTPIDQQDILVSLGLTVNRTTTNPGTNFVLDNTNESAGQYSPSIIIHNGTSGAGDDQWSVYVDNNGSLVFANDAGTEDVIWTQTGTLNFVRDTRLNFNSATLWIGSNGSSDLNRIVFDAATTDGVFQWNDSNDRFEFDNASLLKFGGKDITAGSCAASDLTIDTGGATKELCFCSPANTWNCVSLTSGGPVD